MENNFWDSSTWQFFHLIAALLLAMLAANALKQTIPLLRRSLIPTSVLGGLMLLVTAAVYQGATGQVMFNTAFFGGNGIAIDWTSMVADYLIAYALLGLGAGLMKGRRSPMIGGTLLGGLLRFLAHYVVGAVVWGKYMPETFFGMTMTSPWIYSALYNGSYLLINICLCFVLGLLMWKKLGKYIRGEDLKTI